MISKQTRYERSLQDTRVLPMQGVDFDVYADMVRDAELEFLISAPSHALWKVASWEINSVGVQCAVENGSKIVHGISRSDNLLFVIQHRKYFADRTIFDGHLAQPNDIAVLPPSSHFSAATSGPCQWFSISLPIGLFGTFATRFKRKDLKWIEKDKCIISTAPELAKSLTAELVKTITRLRNRATSSAGIESPLLNALIAAIAGASKKTSLSENTKASKNIMRKVLEHVRCNDWQSPRISDLARIAGKPERTLRRAFNQQLGIGPARYIKLRQLNTFRRALRSSLDRKHTITKIMREFGVSEFGRFAAEYRDLFGESPSKTRRRYLQGFR